MVTNGSDDYMRKASITHLANSMPIVPNSSYSQYLWSSSHPGTYYVGVAWTGSYWQLTSNHGSPVQVGYADSAGSASSASTATYAGTGASTIYCSSFSNSGTGYIIFANGFKIMWGTITTIGNTSYTVSYPTSFASYSRAMCTGTVATGNRQDNGPCSASCSTSSFVLYDCDDTSKTSFWVAVGY
jgi:hypothetical protein